MDRPQAGGYNIYEIALVCDRTMSFQLRAFQTVARNGSVYLRVSAACLPNFFKSRSNVSRSFFERTPATSSIAAACSPNPRVISARPLGVSSTRRTRRSSG